MSSTLALCSCMFCYSYLLFSPTPYCGYMAMYLVEGLDTDNVGSYVGIILASFMIGRALSAFTWGKIADVYGRKFVLLSSLFLSGIFSLMFGLSGTFMAAVVSRFLLGLSNGIVATANTCLSELARGDEEKEVHTVGVFIKTWGISLVVGPLVSGLLSRPMEQHPDTSEALTNEDISGILYDYPFLLPNLFGTFLCILSAVFTMKHLEETLPEEIRHDPKNFLCDSCTWGIQRVKNVFKKEQASPPSQDTLTKNDLDVDNSQMAGDSNYNIDDFRTLKDTHFEEIAMLFATADSRSMYSSSLQRPSVSLPYDETMEKSVPLHSPPASKRGSIYMSDIPEETTSDTAAPSASHMRRRSTYLKVVPDSAKLKTTTISSLLSHKRVRSHIVASWLFIFVDSGVSAIFPLFCMSSGGLGLYEENIGGMLSLSGFLFNISQYKAFTTMLKNRKLYGSMNVSIFISTVPRILIPFSVLLNQGRQDGSITVACFVYLVALLAISNIFGGVFYGCMMIGLNKSVDPEYRAQVNGLSAAGGSVARALGFILAGFSITYCLTSSLFSSPELGMAVLFSVITVVGAATIIFTLHLREDDEIYTGN